MNNNTDCMHRGDEIFYTEIRIGRGGYGVCVHRLAETILYQKLNIRTQSPHPPPPHLPRTTNTIKFVSLHVSARTAIFHFLKKSANDLGLSYFYEHVL